ncbi:uncharacterized protein LOC129596191 [Paramacrobiotus metropolitanus]|uniref:uncharacterized protein LOC129596191 n=1 Tax=Paramacrobiotus metropolitanus TaxID=2943436 RepID=UPI0024461DD1|nr:uncharacterized protein LOC129596191 [Paramacrobiotus metropolitanus]
MDGQLLRESIPTEQRASVLDTTLISVISVIIRNEVATQIAANHAAKQAALESEKENRLLSGLNSEEQGESLIDTALMSAVRSEVAKQIAANTQECQKSEKPVAHCECASKIAVLESEMATMKRHLQLEDTGSVVDFQQPCNAPPIRAFSDTSSLTDCRASETPVSEDDNTMIMEGMPDAKISLAVTKLLQMVHELLGLIKEFTERSTPDAELDRKHVPANSRKRKKKADSKASKCRPAVLRCDRAEETEINEENETSMFYESGWAVRLSSRLKNVIKKYEGEDNSPAVDWAIFDDNNDDCLDDSQRVDGEDEVIMRLEALAAGVANRASRAKSSISIEAPPLRYVDPRRSDFKHGDRVSTKPNAPLQQAVYPKPRHSYHPLEGEKSVRKTPKIKFLQ